MIPTRNRPDKLRRCLAALETQRYPRDRFEVVVVDDGSDPPLGDVVGHASRPLCCRIISQANAGPSRARNHGVEHASGTLLAFTDDDCEPDSGWLPALWSRFTDHPDHAIGGRTANVLTGNAYSTASQLLVDYLYDYYGAVPPVGAARPAAPRFFTSNNLAVPATLFRHVGGFDTSFPLAAGEDREFCDRWQQHGYRLMHAPEAIVNHAHALSLSGFWRQHVNYGRGAWHLRRAHLRRGAQALPLEPVSFYARLLTYPLRRRHWRSALLQVALVVIAQIANASGYFSERRRSRADG